MKKLTRLFFLLMTITFMPLLIWAGCAQQDETAPAPAVSTATSSSVSSSSSTPVETVTPSPSKTYELAAGSCPSASKADRTDASSTAYYYLYITHCWDAVLDTNKTDAVLRASDLMSKEWLDIQKDAAGVKNSSQNAFAQAKKIEAYSVPSVNRTVGDVDQDVAADKAVRGFTTSWYWQARDTAAQQAGGTDQIIVYLEKRAGVWEVVGEQVTSSEEN